MSINRTNWLNLGRFLKDRQFVFFFIIIVSKFNCQDVHLMEVTKIFANRKNLNNLRIEINKTELHHTKPLCRSKKFNKRYRTIGSY